MNCFKPKVRNCVLVIAPIIKLGFFEWNPNTVLWILLTKLRLDPHQTHSPINIEYWFCFTAAVWAHKLICQRPFSSNKNTCTRTFVQPMDYLLYYLQAVFIYLSVCCSCRCCTCVNTHLIITCRTWKIAVCRMREQVESEHRSCPLTHTNTHIHW